MPKYKLNKICPVCGCKLLDNNKTGFCNHHRPRTGKNNPFYGKHHSKDVINHLKETSSRSSKQLWKNEEYRNKVITHATGVKRNDKFKELQRQNALKQFTDENQRKLRSKNMKNSWKTGKITQIDHPHINKSKQEKIFFEMLSTYPKINIKLNQTIQYKHKNHIKWLFPDGIVNDKIIIEYNGSFWHADSRMFKDENTIVHHKITAKEIKERDLNKIKKYESLGYVVICVWSIDFLNDKFKCVENTYNKIKTLLNIE